MDQPKFTVLDPNQKIEELAARAEAEGAKLMTWQYETPSKIRSSEEVRTLVMAIRKFVSDEKSKTPRVTSGELETKLKETLPELYELFETHPRIFKACIHPETSIKEFNRILFMLGMKAQVESNRVSKKDGDAAVSAFLMEDMKIESKDKATPWTVMDRPG